MKFSISAVIPNFNGKSLLEQNLPSLYSALDNSCKDYEIIIADDASSDNSITYLKNFHPKIKLIEGKENKGFAVNANRGIRQAAKELVFLLNNDVKISKDYFTEQLAYFKLQDTFGVMGSIFTEEGKLTDAAKYPLEQGFELKSTVNFFIKNSSPEFCCPTLFLSGANALMNREKLMILGGFNEIYSPFYVEDVDLSIRAWRMGWKCYYESKAKCTHNVSSTIKNSTTKKFVKFISKRNKMIFHKFHLEGHKRTWWSIKLVFNFFVRWAFDFNFYHSFFAYKKLVPEIRKSSQEFKLLLRKQSNSKSLAEVLKHIKTQIAILDKKLF